MRREGRKRKNAVDRVAYSFDDVSSVVEEDNSPPSGPASAPSGTPPFVVVSPTWWKSGGHVKRAIPGPVEGLTEDFTVHHNFPGVHGEVCIVETPVKLICSFRFIGRVMIGSNIFVS